MKTVFALFIALTALLGVQPASAAPNPRPGLEYGADGLVHPGRIVVDPGIGKPPTPPLPTERAHIVAGPPYGGDLMTGLAEPVGALCTNAFNVRSATTQYQTIPGHCTVGNLPDRWQYGPDRYGYYNLGTLQVERYDASGDRSYLRASKDLENKVRTSCCIYTLTAGGDPRLNERVCFALGHSKKTWCGYVGWLDQRSYYDDNTVHGNQAVAYEYTTTGFCPEPGDSGSPGLVGTEAVGWANAVNLVYQTPPTAICYVHFEQLGYALSSQNLVLG